MTDQAAPRQDWIGVLLRKNVLAGLMFMAVAVLGLWLSRNYLVGTALRMGTGYVPRMLCWILLGLGATVSLIGIFGKADRAEPDTGSLFWVTVITAGFFACYGLVYRYLGFEIATLLLVAVGFGLDRMTRLRDDFPTVMPIVFVAMSLVVFALAVERLGLVIATVLLIIVGSVAGRHMRPVEVALTAVVLAALVVAIFIWGLALPIDIWPER